MRQSLCRAGIRVLVLAGLCLPLVCFWQVGASGQRRTRGSTGRGGGSLADPNAPKGVYATAHGVVKSISGSQLFVEVDDDHEMKFRLIHKTKIFSQTKDGQGKDVLKEIKTSSLESGQTVDIDMQNSLDGAFEAVRVVVLLGSPANAESAK